MFWLPLIDNITINVLTLILSRKYEYGEEIIYSKKCPEFLCDFKRNYVVYYFDTFTLDSFTLHNLCWHRESFSQEYLDFFKNIPVDPNIKPDLYFLRDAIK